jgi:hypothetical protein
MTTSTPDPGPGRFSVFCAFDPHGRPMQLWMTPDKYMPELVCDDYPIPDHHITSRLLISTNSFAEAARCWEDNARVLRHFATTYHVSVTTLNQYLEH